MNMQNQVAPMPEEPAHVNEVINPIEVEEPIVEQNVILGAHRNPYQPKFWKVFFLIQTILIIFLLDIAFLPVSKYICNPYKGLLWDYENKTEYSENYCPGGVECWIERNKCLENCRQYQKHLDIVGNVTTSAHPNPLCFHWDDNWGLRSNDPNLPSRLFFGKKKRGRTFETQKSMAYFWNYSSFVILIIWFMIHCGDCTAEYKSTTFLLFFLSLGMYYIGNYLAFNVSDYLKCHHRTAIYNETTSKTIGYEYKPFCNDLSEVKVKNETTLLEETIEMVQLPPMPKIWQISYYILVFRAMTPLVYLLIWTLRVYFGQILKHTSTPYVVLAMNKIWVDLGRR